MAGTIVAEGDIRNQTRKVLESIDQTLQKAGSSLANAASMQVYLKDAGDFAAMNEVYRTFWKADPPTRTTVVADFVVPNALIEISAVAVPTGGTSPGHPSAGVDEIAQPLQLRHQERQHAVSGRPRRPQRQGQQRGRG